ncbi:MAG: glycosyltransferase family 87 protein [Chitinophagales bacterium]|nr:DUF2029 domain-containing protein [Chitinophagales bacterium]MDW8392627.1 glycosyltransferase family 87 protein [Chitinophagales bacterium]
MISLRSSPYVSLIIFAGAGIVTALQQWLLTEPDALYTHYNNFVIFKNAFFHLLQGTNLYIPYPEQQADLYKYSPTFAMAMAPFAILPDLAGLLAWNLLNACVFWAGLRAVSPSVRILNSMGALCLIELITSLQNVQSNGLIAGLLLLAFAENESNRPARAALYVNITAFIKLFGLAAFVLWFFSKDKWKFFLYAAVSAAALAAMPLLLISPTELLQQYRNWWELLKWDYAGSLGFSVAGWLASWFQLNPPKWIITLAGTLLLLMPLYRKACYVMPLFRLFYLSALLLWMVLFNHKAESSTFIVAVAGVALWYFNQRRTALNTILVVLVVLFTILSPVDLYPESLRKEVFVPFVVKAVPCLLVWFKIILDLLRLSYSKSDEASGNRSATSVVH